MGVIRFRVRKCVLERWRKLRESETVVVLDWLVGFLRELATFFEEGSIIVA